MTRTLPTGAILALTLFAGSALSPSVLAQSPTSNRPVSIEPDAAALLVVQNSRTETPAANTPDDSPTALRSPAPAPAPVIESTPRRDPLPLPPQEFRSLGPAPQSSAGGAAIPSPSTGSASTSWLLSTAGALAVVITLIFLTRHALRRLTPGPAAVGHTGGLIQLLARTSIAPRTAILFLRLDQRIIVVAQSPAGLQTLTEITDPDEAARLIARVQASRPRSITSGFRSLLGRFDRQLTLTTGPETDLLDSPALHDVEGRDDTEHLTDRTRNELSELRSRIRLLQTRGADT